MCNNTHKLRKLYERKILKFIQNLDSQIGKLELSIFNLSQATQQDIQIIVSSELNNLRDIQDEISNSMFKLIGQQKSTTDEENILSR